MEIVMIRILILLILWMSYFVYIIVLLKRHKRKKERCTKQIKVYVKDVLVKSGIGGNFFKPIFEAEKDGQKILIHSAIPNSVVRYTKGEYVNIYVNPENYQEYLGQDNGRTVKITTLFGMGVGFLMFSLGIICVGK